MKDFDKFVGIETEREEQSNLDSLLTGVKGYLITPALIIWNDYRARIGALIILFWILMGTVGVYLTSPPEMLEGPMRLPPFQSWEHPIGTDNRGRDLLLQIIHGTPIIFKMMLSGAVFATVFATFIGTLAGYKGDWIERVLMYIVDTAMTIPSLPLVIVLAATIQPENPYLIGIVLSITSWASLSRTIRSQVLSIREESYVEASRTMDLSTITILGRDIIPNIMPYVSVNFVQNARRIIFSSVGLYFLGFLPYQTINWGVTLQLAYDNGALQNPDLYYWFMAPMIPIVTLSLGMILLAQGADRIFNPRIRGKHKETSEQAVEELEN